MKRIIYTTCAIVMMCIMTACGGHKSSESDNVGITDSEYINQVRRMGAADAHIDRESGVFMYGVVSGQVVDADATARLMYRDAYDSGIRGIDECRVIELPSGKMIGRYKN